MDGQDFFSGISKGTFEIPLKISDPYIERYDFTQKVEIVEDLRFRSSYAILKHPPGLYTMSDLTTCDQCTQYIIHSTATWAV